MLSCGSSLYLMISQAARVAVSYATYYDITVYNYDITYSQHHIA